MILKMTRSTCKNFLRRLSWKIRTKVVIGQIQRIQWNCMRNLPKKTNYRKARIICWKQLFNEEKNVRCQTILIIWKLATKSQYWETKVKCRLIKMKFEKLAHQYLDIKVMCSMAELYLLVRGGLQHQRFLVLGKVWNRQKDLFICYKSNPVICKVT